MNENLEFLFTLAKTNTILARRLSGHGLDFTDFVILYHLNTAPDGQLRRVDLANRLGLTASGITRMLLPLEKIGIIQRDLSTTDARARYASLTPAGKNLLADATTTINNKLEDIIPENQAKKIIDVTELLKILLEKN